MGSRQDEPKWVPGIGFVYPKRRLRKQVKSTAKPRRAGAEESLRAAQQQAEKQIADANAALAAGRAPTTAARRH